MSRRVPDESVKRRGYWTCERWITCRRCSRVVSATSNNQRYCGECADEVEQEKNIARCRKHYIAAPPAFCVVCSALLMDARARYCDEHLPVRLAELRREHYERFYDEILRRERARHQQLTKDPAYRERRNASANIRFAERYKTDFEFAQRHRDYSRVQRVKNAQKVEQQKAHDPKAFAEEVLAELQCLLGQQSGE